MDPEEAEGGEWGPEGWGKGRGGERRKVWVSGRGWGWGGGCGCGCGCGCGKCADVLMLQQEWVGNMSGYGCR